MDGDFNLQLQDDTKLIPRATISSLDTAFKYNGVEGCRALLQEKLEDWQNIPLNVAVFGSSGVGKSSFINAIRCVLDRFTLLRKRVNRSSRSSSFQVASNVTCTISSGLAQNFRTGQNAYTAPQVGLYCLT